VGTSILGVLIRALFFPLGSNEAEGVLFERGRTILVLLTLYDWQHTAYGFKDDKFKYWTFRKVDG
jgi:hypothetical protein